MDGRRERERNVGSLLPELSDAEELVVSNLLSDVLAELRDESSVDVLDGVESESLSTGLLEDPDSPVVQVSLDLGVVVIDIGEHEVVVL